MTQTIKLIDIYSADLFTRSMAVNVLNAIDSNSEKVILDFENIGFMSRSFTDELYNIMDSFPKIGFCFINQNEVIRNMVEAVKTGRNKERELGISHAKMYQCDSLESFNRYLVAL